jgi:hypothetical protein
LRARRPRDASPTVERARPVELQGAELAAEIARLQERLRPTTAPSASRNLFRFSAPGRRAIEMSPVAPDVAPPPARALAPPPRLTLGGLAEDVTDAGPVRTAIISGFGTSFSSRSAIELRPATAHSGRATAPGSSMRPTAPRCTCPSSRTAGAVTPSRVTHDCRHHQPDCRRRVRRRAITRAQIANAWLSERLPVRCCDRTPRACRRSARLRGRAAITSSLPGAETGPSTRWRRRSFRPCALGIAGRPVTACARARVDRRPRGRWRHACGVRWRSRHRCGELDGRLFFNVAGVGFDAHIAACFDRELSGRRGPIGYARIIGRELIRYRPLTFRLCTDRSTFAGPALLVTLANSPQFGNGARIAPGARVDDGRLDLVVFREASRMRTLLALPRLFAGSVDRLPGISIEPVEHLTIESDLPLIAHVDGEPFRGGSRLQARVRPAALRVAI